jgi:hypothetical protein
MPCSRRGKLRHVSLNACRFQKGECESLWNQTLKHNNRELAHRAKKLDGNAPASASIRDALAMLNTVRTKVPCQNPTKL